MLFISFKKGKYLKIKFPNIIKKKSLLPELNQEKKHYVLEY